MAALAQHHRGTEEPEDEDNGSGNTRDRAVILDMVPAADGAGFEVGSASSLSPDWAVVSARVSRMEGIDSALVAAHGDNPGTLMLKVEGVSVEPSSGPISSAKVPTPETELQSSGASGTRTPHLHLAQEEYSVLLSEFDNRMAVLRRVVEAGGDRHRVRKGDAQGPGQEVRG